MFDSEALPAAYTEFLYGDCVPHLKRDTKVPIQMIFAALPNREELEYQLQDDVEPYVASTRSRFDTPEFYAVFGSIMKTLKVFQAMGASMDRVGFHKDLKIIAGSSSADFVRAALHDSMPRSNTDLMHTVATTAFAWLFDICFFPPPRFR